MAKLGENTSDVNVCAMMHLLIDVHFQTKHDLYKTIQDVYHNFTSIYKPVVARVYDDLRGKIHETLPDRESRNSTLKSAGIGVRCMITFCRCSLNRILEDEDEDGMMINRSLCGLLADIEFCLLDFVHNSTHHNFQAQVWLSKMKDTNERIREAYYEPYCYRLVIRSDLMIEFLDHCIEDMRDILYETIVELFLFLRKFLESLNNTKVHATISF